jgi:ketosteroid isomerase-like protein
LAGWTSGSPKAISDLFAEEGTFTNPLQPKILIGPKNIHEAISNSLARIRNVQIPITSIFENGSKAVVEGDFLSERAEDGKRFDFPFVIILEMHGNKIGRLIEYFDTFPLRRG